MKEEARKEGTFKGKMKKREAFLPSLQPSADLSAISSLDKGDDFRDFRVK